MLLGNGINGATNGMAYIGLNKNLPNPPNGNGYSGGPQPQDSRIEDFRIYLQDQATFSLRRSENLVQLIR